jgi:hypothetical protein
MKLAWLLAWTYLFVVIHPLIVLEFDLRERCSCFDADAFPDTLENSESNLPGALLQRTDPRIKAGELETPAVDCDEGAELFVGIGRVWLWYAGCVKFGRALAFAMTASPDEVGSVILATTDLMLFLDESMI